MWPNPQKIADLVTFTEEIFDGNIHFLYSIKLYLEALKLSKRTSMKTKYLKKKTFRDLISAIIEMRLFRGSEEQLKRLSYSQLFSAWFPLKDNAHLNKAAAESCRFVQVCMTF